LKEAQRFPDDYDGIIAGAPVYNLLTQSNLLVRWRMLGATQLTSAQLTRLHQEMLAACDENDGLKDGIVTDQRACRFDPVTLQCPAGAAEPSCLSPQQVAAVRTAYAGVKVSTGEIAAYPLTYGSEPEWERFIGGQNGQPPPRSLTPQDGGMSGFRTLLFGDPNYDLSRFDAERDLKRMRSSAFARMFEASDPDISSFVKRGGKLLLWHGGNDPGPSAAATIDYYNEVARTTGRKTSAPLASSVRLFIAPGVYHCRRGPGPDQFDMIDALDRWVERGAAPNSILATKQDSPLSRPLCPYPALPRYQGRGDPNVASNFACRN
jgi:feruloyl esterase